MEIMKIIAVGVIGAVLAIAVKEYKPEFAVCVVILTGITIFAYAASGIADAFEKVRKIMLSTNIDSAYFDSILKVTGIAYVSEYGAEICRDCGHGSIAVKIEIAGKICIMLLTIPIIQSFLQICIEAVKLVW